MSKIAVIYWSGTGNTQQMAEAIANQAHGSLHRERVYCR